VLVIQPVLLQPVLYEVDSILSVLGGMDAREFGQEFVLCFYFSSGQRLAPFLVCIAQPQSRLETVERWQVHCKVGCMSSRTKKATIIVACALIAPSNKPGFLQFPADSVFLLCNN